MASTPPRAARIAKTWLDVVFFLGVAGAGVLAVWLLVSPLVMRGGGSGVDASVAVAIGEGSLRPVLPVDAGEVDGVTDLQLVHGQGELRLETTDWGLQFMTSLGVLVGLGLVLFVIHQIRRLLGSVLEGRPFSVENAGRLTTIGWIFFGAGLLVPLVECVGARVVLSRIGATALVLSPPFDVREDAVVGGLLVLALAAVWRYGVQLEEDRSLTV